MGTVDDSGAAVAAAPGIWLHPAEGGGAQALMGEDVHTPSF